MYRQVMIDKPDDNFQLILWRSKPVDPIQILRLRTVTYGTAPGAYLAIKSMHQLAQDEGETYPLGAKLLKENFYVDDVMFGSDSKTDLMQGLNELHAILKKGGLSLSKHCSNVNEILNGIPPEHREKFLNIDENEVIKTLGLVWQPDSDVFHFTYTKPESTEHVTKRTILSEIARFFDPLGMICPVITLAKIFYQDLWKMKFQWDTELPSEFIDKWKHFRLQFPLLKNVTVPRYIMVDTDVKVIELHGFSDACEKSYGACAYVRSVHGNNQVKVQLLQAKSRVAPTKTLTVARLELLGAELLSELIARLINEVFTNTKIYNIYYWTDSSIVLSWLAAEPYKWNVFVSHRVTKIQNKSLGNWRHVPGELNPADLISRGALPKDLITSNLWWNGPEFLKQEQRFWPSSFTVPDSSTVTEERRVTKVALSSIMTKTEDVTSSMQFSVDYRGIRRVFVYVRRFINNCRTAIATRKEPTNSILYHYRDIPSIQEEDEAEKLFVKSLQMSAFPEEYKLLQSNQVVPKTSKLKSLSPFLDEIGLIRVGGRLKNAQIGYDAKHQMR